MYIFFLRRKSYLEKPKHLISLMMDTQSNNKMSSHPASAVNPTQESPLPVSEPMEVSSSTNEVPFGVSPLKRPEGYVPKKVQDSKRRGRAGQPNYMRFGVICHVCRKFGHRARHCRLRLPPPQPTSPPVPLMSIDFDKADEPKSESSSSVTLILFEPDPFVLALMALPKEQTIFYFLITGSLGTFDLTRGVLWGRHSTATFQTR